MSFIIHPTEMNFDLSPPPREQVHKERGSKAILHDYHGEKMTTREACLNEDGFTPQDLRAVKNKMRGCNYTLMAAIKWAKTREKFRGGGIKSAENNLGRGMS